MDIRRFFFAALLLPLAAWAYQPDLRDLNRVPQLQLDSAQIGADIAQLRQQPTRFAVAQDLQADAGSGSWDETADGMAHWRLRIASPGAASLGFHLEDLQLPEGAELWVYTADGRDAQGPYTVQDNGALWTAIVRSDEAVIEARMPATSREQFRLRLAQAFHAYRPIDSGDYVAKGYFGNAGACTIDVACSDGNNWRNEIRSTVLLTISGTTLCSGTLLNNTSQNDRPLVLTANHCGINASNVTQTKAYFNVQKASCGATASGPVTQNIAGKTLLASTTALSSTDYALFELASKPPGSFNVHYAGWDVSGAVPASGVGISHPAGDDKKIATFSSPPSSQNDVCIGVLGVANVCVGFIIRGWAVSWSHGATQGGSSGSGLWNPNHRVVATLSGGSSACSASNPSISNGESDIYARLDQAWTAASSTGTTLKTLLDPLGSSCTGIDGKNPGSAGAASCAQSGASNGSTSGGGSSDSGGGGGALGLDLLPLLALACWRRRSRVR